MIAAILAFFTTTWGKRILFGVVGSAAIGALALGAYTRGQGTGYASGKQDGLSVGHANAKTELEAEREQYLAVISQQTGVIQHSNDAIREATSAVARADERLSAIRASRERDRGTVTAVPDSGLRADISNRLGIRTPGDDSASFTVPEMREIDLRLADYGHAVAMANELSAKVDILDKRVKATEEKVGAIERQRDQAMQYGDRVYTAYAQLWNENPPRYRSWKCVKLWKCGKMHIDPPAQASFGK